MGSTDVKLPQDFLWGFATARYNSSHARSLEHH